VPEWAFDYVRIMCFMAFLRVERAFEHKKRDSPLGESLLKA